MQADVEFHDSGFVGSSPLMAAPVQKMSGFCTPYFFHYVVIRCVIFANVRCWLMRLTKGKQPTFFAKSWYSGGKNKHLLAENKAEVILDVRAQNIQPLRAQLNQPISVHLKEPITLN